MSFHTLKMLWTVKPELPQAVSMILSPTVGFIIFTHISIIPRREILTLFALLCLAHQVFKGIVNHIQLLLNSLISWKRGNTDGKMGRREQNFAFLRKNTFPFPLGVVKQAFEFSLSVQNPFRRELRNFKYALGSRSADQFVVELGKNQLENFLERIHSGTGKHLIFHFLNQNGEAIFDS